MERHDLYFAPAELAYRRARATVRRPRRPRWPRSGTTATTAGPR